MTLLFGIGLEVSHDCGFINVLVVGLLPIGLHLRFLSK